MMTLWDKIGRRKGVSLELDIHVDQEVPDKIEIDQADGSSHLFVNQTDVYQKSESKTHWDFLLKELEWMADDFQKETKKKSGDAKKLVRNCKKHINEQLVQQEKKKREVKHDLKRKSKFMSNIVGMYWKSCEKIVKHNYNVEYERKRQQLRTKKLENFVSKHLKLSVKVAEQLNTN